MIVKELNAIRKEIDAIDDQLARLFEARLNLVLDVARYKDAHGLPVFDEARENIVLEKGKNRIENPDFKEDFAVWLRQLMDLAKKQERELLSINTVAYCGVEGAFAHSAASRLFPYANLKSCSSFGKVFKAVINHEAQYGVLPLENSNSGLVGEVLDGLMNYPVYIDQVADVRIKQCLLGTQGADLSMIEWVYSKDQALWQSKDFLDALHVQTVPYPNTAMAAQYVAQTGDPKKAAIGAKENAELYGLKVLAENIESDSSNTTRFLVISAHENPKPGDHCGLLISVNSTVGSLAKAINVISAFGLNMDSLQSRPRKGHPFEYFFYVQAEGDLKGPNLEACMQALGPVCTIRRWLGSFSIRKEEEDL